MRGKEVAVITQRFLRRYLLRGVMFVLAAALVTGGVTASAAQDESGQRVLVPLGSTAGIRMFADGVLVVGMCPVDSGGTQVSPAESAGIAVGDRILEINSVKVESAEQLRQLVGSCETVEVTLERDGKQMTVTAEPAPSADSGERKLGAWVRDSIAGIGTLTYYDPETGAVGALGHGVTDSDTKSLMPISSGSLVHSSVDAVRKGTPGSPGELQGSFASEYGTIIANTERGVFGYVDTGDLTTSQQALPVASTDEIVEGDAVILSSVQGEEVREYAVKILRVYADGAHAPRDMLIEVTDPDLLEATGGIVQGMSGSPVIQNGKLIGAVTHVLINDPTRGYAISMDSMLEYADSLT